VCGKNDALSGGAAEVLATARAAAARRRRRRKTAAVTAMEKTQQVTTGRCLLRGKYTKPLRGVVDWY
jgi:hypothetical protein